MTSIQRHAIGLNDTIKSPVHRVRAPPECATPHGMVPTRYSIPYVCLPRCQFDRCLMPRRCAVLFRRGPLFPSFPSGSSVNNFTRTRTPSWTARRVHGTPSGPRSTNQSLSVRSSFHALLLLIRVILIRRENMCGDGWRRLTDGLLHTTSVAVSCRYSSIALPGL